MDATRDLVEPKLLSPEDFASNSYGLSSYSQLLGIEDEITSNWPYQPGDVVMEEIPYASVVSSNFTASLCHSCYHMEEADKKLKRCARCRFARYCDDGCAKKAWPVHKMECSLLESYSKSTGFFPDAMIRLVNLVMIKVWRGQMTMPSEACTPPTDREFDSLCSHTSEIDEELEKSQKFKANMQEIAKFIGAGTLMEIGEDIVAEVYSRVVTNTISIVSRTGTQLGIGLYFGISQFDHSCVPNAIYIARKEAPQMQIVALAPIRTLDQVKISYVDPVKPTEQRRTELKESFYFSCSCNRCHAVERDGMARSLRCPNKRCDGFILLGKDWIPLGPCVKCDVQLEQSDSILKDGKELMLAIDDFIDANTSSLLFLPDSTPDDNLVELLLGLEQISTRSLFKLNYYHLRLSTCLLQYYTFVGRDWGKCLDIQMELIAGYRFNLGPVSMQAYLALVEAARLLVKMEDKKGLEKIVAEARLMAKIIFDPDDCSHQELLSLIN